MWKSLDKGYSGKDSAKEEGYSKGAYYGWSCSEKGYYEEGYSEKGWLGPPNCGSKPII